jgi:hypothetical protein
MVYDAGSSPRLRGTLLQKTLKMFLDKTLLNAGSHTRSQLIATLTGVLPSVSIILFSGIL